MTLFERVAAAIVDRRNLIFFTYIIVIVFSLFSMHWTQVEDDITYYLAEESKTRQGITLMNEQFTTFGMAEIMISNISLEHAQEVAAAIGEVAGVSSLMFDGTESYYRNSAALFVVLFGGEETDTATLRAMEDIRILVAPYDASISTAVGVDPVAQLTKDMTLIGVLAAIVIVLVLTFTSRSYAEVPVLLLTFGAAALIHSGTNFLLGKISFISNSVGVVLQLALAVDYAIILCHRFTEERERFPAVEAAAQALSKAIPEISSSSLTTIGGLGALAFIQFGIGKDLAAVMIKAILLSMLSVFTLMPGLLVLLSDWMQKTKHRNLVPSVAYVGRFAIRTRRLVPPIFAVVLAVSFVLSSRCPFLFSLEEIRAHRVSASQQAADRIKANFGSNNILALIVPSGEYAAEKKLLAALSALEEVESAIGLANTEAMDGYMLADYLTPRQFSELLDLDFEVARLLYSAYAVNGLEYGRVVSGISDYAVPLIDMYQFLYDEVIQEYLGFDSDITGELEEYNALLSLARKQMQGDDYSRMVLHVNLPVESEETYRFLNTVYHKASQYYDRDLVFIVGESTNALDLSSTFANDNLVISILSVIFVVIVLTLTFQSAGLPLLLIAVIQASIWINFSLPYLRGHGLYFLGYLIVSSIQMGANIDYAIVISSRYLAQKRELPPKQAVVAALDQSFPTVITSGSMLAVAGLLIGRFSTDGATAVLGSYLGQGTIISIALVIFVLPQLLYLGDVIIERSSFQLRAATKRPPAKKSVRYLGHLRGHVHGEVDAFVDGTISGKIQKFEAGGDKPGEKGTVSDEDA